MVGYLEKENMNIKEAQIRALQKFKKAYPASTSGDLQAFTLGMMGLTEELEVEAASISTLYVNNRDTVREIIVATADWLRDSFKDKVVANQLERIAEELRAGSPSEAVSRWMVLPQHVRNLFGNDVKEYMERL